MESDENDPGLKSKNIDRPPDENENQPQLQTESEIEVIAYTDESNNNLRSHPDEYDNDPTTPDQSESESDESDSDSEEDIPDESLGTTILREIQEGTYICLVCTGEIDQHSKIWTCIECFRVYDLDCIQDWAIRGSSTNKTSKEWRCPSCNHATNKIPKKFTCWCGKITNPDKNTLMPFSCGNSCNYKYDDCIHNCLSICHPGKHPICGAMGPMMKCKCGKDTRQLPCLITPYDKGWRCEEECTVPVCDLNHKCGKGCHAGFCGLCQENVTMKCYCGGSELSLKCHEKVLKKCTDANGDSWIGIGSCGQTQKTYYDCNEHFELRSCQPPISHVRKCKFSPDVITTCYCGKTKVDVKHRTKCTDPVPECNNVCGKLLPCGCRCKFKCHEGECECISVLDIKCECGHESYLAPCKYVQSGMRPKCDHKCSVLLNCRKHYHRVECCPSEKIGIARERERKKAIRNNTRSNFREDDMSIEAAHICTRTCNRLKSCGKHECQALCHSGPCDVCLESTNEDLVCHCGKTIIPAPVRCGTELVCHEQCIRQPPCGHRPEHHECHDDSVSCPKCTALVTRECDCGAKSDLPGILCSQERVSCGKMCMVPKDCGHACLKTCSADCTKKDIHASSKNCQSYCKKVRTSCPHLCKLKCHFNKVGSSKNCDVVRCTEEISVTCECGRLTKKIKCGASVNEPSAIGKCDETCVAAKRDAALRAAFMGTPEESTDESIPYSEDVLTTFSKQKSWCSKIESIIRTFISDYNTQIENGVSSPKKSYHFPPMTAPQRKFVHELGAAFNAYTESQDIEPKRSVFFVITRLTTVPAITIEQALEHQAELEAEKNRVKEMKQEDIDEALFNGIVIQDLFFGVTIEDLERELRPLCQGKEDYILQWLKDSIFMFYSPDKFKNMDIEEENGLYLLVKSFKKVLRDKSLAFDCKLCLVDGSASFILKTDSSRANSVPVEEAPKQSQNTFDILQNDELVDGV
ncbi:LOW QUALITY PROTEIN: FAP1 FKBP12-associated protein 1 [Candida maltosa Xu316]